MRLEPKDIFTISLSSASLIAAAVNFYITFRQRATENKRAVRKSLTDTMASMGEINLAFAKLNAENPEPSEAVLGIRRVYNSQRRYLLNHAEYLSLQIPELTTDIDHLFMALAFDALLDSQRAEHQWNQCIEKSPAPAIRVGNLRGFARFCFYQGNAQKGRHLFEEALKVSLPDNDVTRRFQSETYVLWSVVERDFGFMEEAERRAALARIGHSAMRQDISLYIDSLWGSKEGRETGPILAPNPSLEPAPPSAR